jgi:hypothetical protein
LINDAKNEIIIGSLAFCEMAICKFDNLAMMPWGGQFKYSDYDVATTFVTLHDFAKEDILVRVGLPVLDGISSVLRQWQPKRSDAECAWKGIGILTDQSQGIWGRERFLRRCHKGCQPNQYHYSYHPM